MARIAILSYIKRKSPVHELTGTTKLIFFLSWSVASMVTYDTRVLVCMLAISVLIFKISRIKIRDISVVLGLAAVFLLLNNLFVYLFAPEYGVELYGSRTVLFTIAGPYTITLQQLFYHLNMTMKVICVVPVALLFIACTDPSEFAASLASIGVSYRVGYSVSLALRYIPDVQREYHNISQAQQARGIDLSGKDKVFTRMKNSVAILLPLILSSLNRIETVSNAMELRGFGKNKKRTWYVKRPMKRSDWLTISFAAAILILDLVVTFWDGSRYFNPFEQTAKQQVSAEAESREAAAAQETESIESIAAQEDGGANAGAEKTAEDLSENIAGEALKILPQVRIEAGSSKLTAAEVFENYEGQEVIFSPVLSAEELMQADAVYEVSVSYQDNSDTVTVEIVDSTPPVMQGISKLWTSIDGSVSYKKGIELSDNAAGEVSLEIDNSEVNLSEPGTYQVYYTAVDAAGNETKAETTVTVSASDVPTEEEANALADELIAQIITPGMSKYETAYTLWYWCRNNITYAVSKGDYANVWEGGYEGLKKRKGDCYTYCATYAFLLDRCGIDNMRVARVGGTSEHRWNLVNVGNGWYHCDCSPRRNGDSYQCFMQTDAQVQVYTASYPQKPNYYVFDESLYPERATTVIFGEDPGNIDSGE